MSWIIGMTIAIVVQDQTPLMASPEERASRQAILWQGDWLEVRGQTRDFLKVYHHRLERGGFVQLHHVRTYRVGEESAPELRAVVSFLRDTPQAEALGIGYAALYLRVAPPAALDSSIFFAMGTMADRLATLVSRRNSKWVKQALTAHLEVVQSYGVRMVSLETEERARLCYDGEAFRRVLAMTASPEEKARAALALTRLACVRPDLRPAEKRVLYQWFLTQLQRVDPNQVLPYLGNRLRLRRSIIGAQLSFEQARLGQLNEAARLNEEAMNAYLRVDRAQLTRGDWSSYQQAALYLSATRWARETSVTSQHKKLRLKLDRRASGETCIQVFETAPRGRNVKKSAGQPELLIQRCTYGLVWPASVRFSPKGKQILVAVQHLPGWLELWHFQRRSATWEVTTLAPAVLEPHLGYVDLAGWTPRDEQLLLVREAWHEGQLQRRFQLLRASDLAVTKESWRINRFASFRRWQSPLWKKTTLALRQTTR